LGGADPNLNWLPEGGPQVVETAELHAAGEGIQGQSEVLAAVGSAQGIVPDPVTQAVLPGSAFSITAMYSTAEPVDETLTGLGLRLHYNSSLLQWDRFSDVYTPGKIAQDSSPRNDAADSDGDPSTDMYLTIAWMDLSSNWPGAGLTPLALYVANFTALPAFAGGSTTINFSASSTAAGWTLDATSATITLENLPPTVELANTVVSLPENMDTTSRVKVADIVVTDDALGTNALSLSGADAASFEIEGLALYLKAGTALDYETKARLNVVVAVDDPAVGGTPDETVALSLPVTDVNEAPTVALANTITSRPENTDTTSRIKVADIVVTDDALGTNVLSLSGADAALLEIEGLALYLKAGTVLDYETKAALNVAVAVDDPAVEGTPDDTAALSINIIDVNEAPTVDLANTITSLPENADTSSRIKVADTVVMNDALGTNVLSLDGADAALFEIVGTGLYLRAGTVLDYETKAVLNVTVAVDDPAVGGTPDAEAALSIAVTDVNEAPTVALANTVTSLAENTDTASRVKVADIVVTDGASGTNVLSLSGADAALFEIVDAGLYLRAGTVLDYEAKAALNVTVAVDDPAVGATPDAEAVLSIPVTDVNEAPAVALANTVTSLAENTDTTSRIKVADIVVVDDALGTNVLGLSGADASLFEIEGLVLYLQAGTALDYETKAVLNVTVAVDDPAVGDTPDGTAPLAISVTDVNEAPTVALANTITSLAENTDTTNRIKVADIVVTDDASSTNVLSLSGADAALFEIVDTGLYLKGGTVLDYEVEAVLNVTVAVDDAGVGATPDATAALSIPVTDVNEAPAVALANTVTSLAENTVTTSRVKVADIVMTDDASGTNVLSLSGADAALFEIVEAGLYLRAGTVLDYETKAALNVAVAVDDPAVGDTPDGTVPLAISVTDVNEAPAVALANTIPSLAENTDTTSRVKVADIVVTDDASGTNVLSLEGADAALFEIVEAGLYLRAGTVLDYETKAVLNVTVEVDNPAVGSTLGDTAALSIPVTDVNEAPTVALANTATSLAENTDTSSRIKVAHLAVTDDASGVNALSLEGADAALFEIVDSGLYLRVGTVLDYETQAVLNVAVAVDDAGVGGTPDGTATLAISITDVNEPPVVVNDTATTDEDTPVTILAMSLLSNDRDPDADTLSIVGIDSTGTQGWVIDNGDGTYTYDPNGQFHYLPVGASATDSFMVAVSDEHGLTATTTVTITVTGASDLMINRYSVRSSKIVANNCIKMSGYFDVPETEIVAGAQIAMRILASGGAELFNGAITISTADLRQGVYTYRASLPKGSSGAVTLLKLDTKRHTFDLCVEGMNLLGLSYPLTLTLAVSDYLGSDQTQ